MLKLEDIRRVHVELTTRCNARCPMCMRNYRGMDFNSGYPITELTLEQFKQIFTPDILAGIMQPDPPINGKIPVSYGFPCGFSFNGNLGDFGLAHDGIEIVEYLVDHGVPMLINTNGSIRTPSWWARLALPNVEIGWAIDGLADTHALYRQDTDWYKIIENATAFIRAGGLAVWRFAPFKHNLHQEQACKDLAAELGFRGFKNIYDGRNNGPAFTRSGEFSHQIGYDPGFDGNPRDIKPLLENHITWYDSKTVSDPRDTAELNIQCIHKRNKEIYVAADGTVYPCCFLGFYPATMNHPGNRELAPLIQKNNALEYPLAECLEWFDRIEETWQLNSVSEGRTYQCIKTCNRP